MTEDTLKLIRGIFQLTSIGLLIYANYLTWVNDWTRLPHWIHIIAGCLWGSVMLNGVINNIADVLIKK